MQALTDGIDTFVVGISTGLLVQSAIGTGEPATLEAFNGFA